MKLRPAKQLAKETQKSRKLQKESYHKQALDKAVAEIEAAHNNGKREIYSLTFPESVVEALKKEGYKVRYLPACGMGDMDSHNISW